jgi:hypothetical protein
MSTRYSGLSAGRQSQREMHPLRDRCAIPVSHPEGSTLLVVAGAAGVPATAPVTGLTITGVLGNEVACGKGRIAETGLSIAKALGTATAKGRAIDTQAGLTVTGSLQSVPAKGRARATETGFSITKQLATVTARGEATIDESGLFSTPALGNEVGRGKARTTPAGLVQIKDLAVVTANGGAVHSPGTANTTGLAIAGTLASAQGHGKARNAETGFASTSVLGSVTADGGVVVPSPGNASVTGLQLVGALGVATASGVAPVVAISGGNIGRVRPQRRVPGVARVSGLAVVAQLGVVSARSGASVSVERGRNSRRERRRLGCSSAGGVRRCYCGSSVCQCNVPEQGQKSAQTIRVVYKSTRCPESLTGSGRRVFAFLEEPMAGLYELEVRTSGVTIATPALELRATTRRLQLRRMELTLQAATASTYGLGRPAAVGTTGTNNAAVPAEPAGAATTALVLLAGWGVAPTAPTSFIRRAGFPATAGSFENWDFDGWVIPPGGSLVLWNIAGNGVADVFLRFYEE